MKQWLKRLAYGFVLWAILYAISIPLLPLQASDLAAFKAVMAMLGSLFGAGFAALYFRSITGSYLREALYTAITWVLINWLMDIVALLPFTKQTITQYFMEIGVEYLGMFGILLAIGYLLDSKSNSQQ